MKHLIWYKNDLRVKDHEPLFEASGEGVVLAVYCFDPRHFQQTPYGFPKTDSFRAKFLIESVRKLRENLRKLGGELIIRTGKPEDILPEIVKEAGIDRIHTYKEITSEEKSVLASVEDSVDCKLITYWGNSLYHLDDLPFEIYSIPDVFTQFRKGVEKKSDVRDEIKTPEQMKAITFTDSGEIPTLEDLDLNSFTPDQRSVLEFEGGEDKARKRLNHYFWETDELLQYKYKRNGLLGTDYSSKLSPWLAHGCISPVSVYHEVKRYENEREKNISTYWLIFELIWRDYFRFSALKYSNRIFHLGGIQDKKLQKSTEPEVFQKWAHGQTGIPFIDANMRELNNTGYMSNRGRQNTASFLSQNLNFDWRWGAAYFESKLIDYDVHSNWGNWAYNATVGHDPRNRYFNIINQAKKYDKKGEYIRQWLPELKNLPKEFVHEPWKMTPDQQTLYEVEIGKDYPKSMINLEDSYEEIKNRD